MRDKDRGEANIQVKIKTGHGLTERKTDIEDGKETDRKHIDIEKDRSKIENRRTAFRTICRQ